MQIKPHQFVGALQRGLVPVYLLSGEEPQQLGELADMVRTSAKQAGYLTREVLVADKNFDWKQLHNQAATASIFADMKVMDLRLPSGTPGQDGAKALSAYCKQPPDDTLLLITAGKINAEGLKSAWAQAIDKIGVIVQVWPLTGAEFSHWLSGKLQKRGLTVRPDALAMLADRLEGNMLAATQEVEKLYALHGASTVGQQEVSHAVADNSRYDVYKLAEAALSAKPEKILKILASLHAEGIAPAIVLWALMREARLVITYKAAQGDRDLILKKNGVWGGRKQIIEHAAKRLSHDELNWALVIGAQTDRQIKGQQQGDAWSTLLKLGLKLASVNVLREDFSI